LGSNGTGATSFGGSGNRVAGFGNNTRGFAVFGNDNTVEAGPGPFALAGSVLQNGKTVTKAGPGIAINNIRIGGAAAEAPSSPAACRAVRGNAR
jgi:hypothetical protein